MQTCGLRAVSRGEAPPADSDPGPRDARRQEARPAPTPATLRGWITSRRPALWRRGRAGPRPRLPRRALPCASPAPAAPEERSVVNGGAKVGHSAA